MPESRASSVIQKKARQAREELDSRGMSASKALRLSLERSADRLFGLALVVRALEQRRVPLSGIIKALGEDRLVMLLEGPETARGGAALDRDVVQALLEVQTMGQVRSGPAPERPFTGTDAAIAAPLMDAMLRGLDEKLAEAGAATSPGRYCFGDRLADSRGLALALEDQDYELFQITADIGNGAKSGVLSVLLPFAALNPPREKVGRSRAGGGDLRATALTAPVALDAVLARIELPLSQLWKLEPGMLLPIPPQAIAQTELVAAGGHVVARARLGQVNGFRAVRLEEPAPTEKPPPPQADAASTEQVPDAPPLVPAVRSPAGGSGATARHAGREARPPPGKPRKEGPGQGTTTSSAAAPSAEPAATAAEPRSGRPATSPALSGEARASARGRNLPAAVAALPDE